MPEQTDPAERPGQPDPRVQQEQADPRLRRGEPTARPGHGEPAPALTILPVHGIDEVRPGDELADLIARAAGETLRDDDILVVTSKIVSKAEGRIIAAPREPQAREAARQTAVDAEAVRVVAARGRTRIVVTRHGLVLAAAGVDASNVDPDRLVLLPNDPDASARALRTALSDRLGLRLAVVISDTMGRPWRTGQTDVAIGAAGLDPLRDYRGRTDDYGNEMSVTAVAVIDELAAAGDLVKAKSTGVPVAIVRGLGRQPAADGPGAVALVRDPADDLFALGTAEARAAGRRSVLTALTEPAGMADTPVPADVLRRVVGAVRAGASQPDLWRYVRVHTPPARRALSAALAATGELTDAGADHLETAPELLAAFRSEPVPDSLDDGPEAITEFPRRVDGLLGMRDALIAEGLAGRQVLRSLVGGDKAAAALGVPADWTFLAAVAIGYPAEPIDQPDADPGDALLER